MRQHAGVERTRAEHHPFGPLDGFERRPARRGRHGLEPEAADPAGCGGHRSLAADFDDGRRLTGVETGHLRNDVDARVRQRQHSPGGSQQPGSKIEGVHRRALALGERAEHQIADGMTGQRPSSAEPVLEQLRPGGRPAVGTGERGQRHPQITHGQRSQLRAEPTRRSTVVTYSHNRGEVAGDAPQRPQRGGQAVATAEGHHRGTGTCHSRPRSR